MIVAPRTPEQAALTATFLEEYAGVQPSKDLVMIGWLEQDSLKIVVGMHGFLGKVCQIHIAFAPDWHFSPREMLRVVFNYAFVTRGCELLIGIVNSKNEQAMRFDAHLGFKELHRIPGMHDDGGDIVILGLRKSDCKYLKKEEAA